jgi:hypothetical protein
LTIPQHPWEYPEEIDFTVALSDQPGALQLVPSQPCPTRGPGPAATPETPYINKDILVNNKEVILANDIEDIEIINIIT